MRELGYRGISFYWGIYLLFIISMVIIYYNPVPKEILTADIEAIFQVNARNNEAFQIKDFSPVTLL